MNTLFKLFLLCFVSVEIGASNAIPLFSSKIKSPSRLLSSCTSSFVYLNTTGITNYTLTQSGVITAVGGGGAGGKGASSGLLASGGYHLYGGGGGNAGQYAQSTCLPAGTLISGITIGAGGANSINPYCSNLPDCGIGGNTVFTYGTTQVTAVGGFYADTTDGSNPGDGGSYSVMYTQPHYYLPSKSAVDNYNIFNNADIPGAHGGASHTYSAIGGSAGGTSILVAGGAGGNSLNVNLLKGIDASAGSGAGGGGGATTLISNVVSIGLGGNGGSGNLIVKYSSCGC